MLSISVGPLVLTPQHMIFFTAFGAALLVGWLRGRRQHIAIEPVLTRMLLWGLAAARLAFVAVYAADYWREPWRIIDIRDGGFIYQAGIAVALLIAGYHAWRQRPARRALGAAVASGVLIWSVGTLWLSAEQYPQPPAQALPLTTLEGQPQSLSALRGRPLVVNLWATWCPPCRREMPVFAEAQRRERDVEFLFVNQGESSTEIAEYLEREQLALRNVFVDPHRQWARELSAGGMPTTLFFDEAGVLVGSHTGELSTASLKQALRRFAQ